MTAAVDWREMLPSEVKKLRKDAVAAGYENPYPESGMGTVLSIEDRCPGCGKTRYVSMGDDIWCPYQRCPKYKMIERIEVAP